MGRRLEDRFQDTAGNPPKLPSTPGAGQNAQALRWNNASGVFEWFTPGGGGGSGDVVGPSSATDNALCRFDTTTGKLIQNSGVTVEDDNAIEGAAAVQFAMQPSNPATTPAQSVYIDDGSNYDAGTLVVGTTLTPAVLLGETSIGDPGFEQGSISVAGVTYEAVFKVNDLGGPREGGIIVHRHSTTYDPNVVFARTNSNTAAHAAVTDGMLLGRLAWCGHDGTSYQRAAEWRCYVDGTPGSNDMPGRLQAYVTPDGSKVPALALSIYADKSVRMEQHLELAEISAPGTPASGYGALYAKTDGKVYWKDDTGAETDLGGDVVGPASSIDSNLARYDGTTGKLLQDSLIKIGDPGYFTIPEVSAPGTPGAGKVSIYAKAGGSLYIKDDTGAETDLAATGAAGNVFEAPDDPTRPRWDYWYAAHNSVSGLLALGGAGTFTSVQDADGWWCQFKTRTIGAFNAFRTHGSTSYFADLQHKPKLVVRIKTGADADHTLIWIGFSSSPGSSNMGTADPSGLSLLAIRYNSATDTNWQLATKDGTTLTTTDTGVAFAVDTVFVFVLYFDGTNAKLEIDGGAATSTTSNLPAAGTLLGGIVMIDSDTAGDRRDLYFSAAKWSAA